MILGFHNVTGKVVKKKKKLKIFIFQRKGKAPQTSVRYSTCEAEGPKKRESRDGLRLLSPSFA